MLSSAINIFPTVSKLFAHMLHCGAGSCWMFWHPLNFPDLDNKYFLSSFDELTNIPACVSKIWRERDIVLKEFLFCTADILKIDCVNELIVVNVWKLAVMVHRKMVILW